PPTIQGQRRVAAGSSSSRMPRSIRSWWSKAPFSGSAGGGVLSCGAAKLTTSARSDVGHQAPCLGKFGRNEQRTLQRVARVQSGAAIQVASSQIGVSFGGAPAGCMLGFLPLGLECSGSLPEPVECLVLLTRRALGTLIQLHRIQQQHARILWREVARLL